jgi:hypothetical protein
LCSFLRRDPHKVNDFGFDLVGLGALEDPSVAIDCSPNYGLVPSFAQQLAAAAKRYSWGMARSQGITRGRFGRSFFRFSFEIECRGAGQRTKRPVRLPYGTEANPRDSSLWGKVQHSILDSEPSPLTGIEFYSFTYVIGHPVIQTLAARWTRIDRRAMPVPFLQPNSCWDPAVVRFWPKVPAAVTWPPPKYRGGDTIDNFIARL